MLSRIEFSLDFDDDALSALMGQLKKEDDFQEFILRRDIMVVEPHFEKTPDFIEEELNVFNNICRNPKLDRVCFFKNVEGKQINIDSLNISQKDKKLLSCQIVDQKIGLSSALWEETIEKKMEYLIKSKFHLISVKLRTLQINIEEYSELIEYLGEEIGEKEYLDNKALASELKFIHKYASKNGLKEEMFNSDMEIIREANVKSPIVLVTGEPLVGKTSVSKMLADKLNLLYLSPENLVKDINEKVAKFEEILEEYLSNYPEPEEDEENKEENQEEDQRPPKPDLKDHLEEMEYKIYINISEGGGLEEPLYTETIKYLLNCPLGRSRGVVIDQNSCLAEKSFIERLLLDKEFGDVRVDYLIELVCEETELERRIKTMQYSLKTNDLISERDIELIKRPKKEKKLTFKDEPVEEEEEEEPPVEDEDLPEEILEILPKPDDFMEIDGFKEDLAKRREKYKEIDLPLIKELKDALCKTYFIRQDTEGLDIDMTVDNLKTKMPLVADREVPKVLEEAGDFKDLLTQNREGMTPPRRWSFWNQIDPVALKDEHLILTGSAEFAVEYFGRVFVFVSEANRDKFFKNCKFYLENRPKVPEKYRVAIFGPARSGKKTIAEYLNREFGWAVQDIESAFTETVKKQKSEEYTPNCEFNYPHFNQEEFKDVVIRKNPVDFISKIVFWLYSIGIPLEKKRTKEEMQEFRKYHEDKLYHMLNPPVRKKKAKPVPEENEEEEEENSKDNKEGEKEEKKGKEGEKDEKEAEKDKKEGEENEAEEEEEEESVTEYESYDDPFPPEEEYEIEEIPSTKFYYAWDANYNRVRPGGFIFINFPLNEDEVKKMKEFGIKVDKVINITCNAEEDEEPLRPLCLRLNEDFDDLEDNQKETIVNKVKDDLAASEELLNQFKAAHGEEFIDEDVIEVNTADSEAVVEKKLRLALDPFVLQADDEDKIVTQNELEETALPVPKGNFGDVCPVTLKKEGWLFYGLPEFESYLSNRRYRLATEEFQTEFKENPSEFTQSDLEPIKIPPPHICLAGYQQSGVTQLCQYLSKMYRLKYCNLKEKFTEQWEVEVTQRHSARIEKKRAELELEAKEREEKREQGEEASEIDIEEQLKDEALLEEDEEYDATLNDKKIFNTLFFPETPTVYDASWYDLDEKIATDFFEMLYENRKTPNVFVIVNVTLETILKRFYVEEKIKSEREELEKEWLRKKQEKIEELRKQREAEIEERKKNLEEDEELDIEPFSKEEEEAVMEEEEEENSKPADLYIMLETEKSALIKRYEDNQGFIEKLKEDLASKNVPFIEVSNDVELGRVKQKLMHLLSPYLTNRKNMIEKQLVEYKFEEMNLRKTWELEHSGVLKHSVYGRNSSVNPLTGEAKSFPTVYRDKLYFFNSEEEQLEFIERPLDFRTGKQVPEDSVPRQIVFVIGMMQTGKKTTAETMKGLGYTVVNFKDTLMPVEQYLMDCNLSNKIKDFVYNNKELEDDLIVKILERRLQMDDLACKDIVIYDLPFTLNQVHLLEESGVVPDFVFVCTAPEEVILQRAKHAGTFKKIDTIIHERFTNQTSQITDIIQGYRNSSIKTYFIDSQKSKWFNSDLVTEIVLGRRRAAREVITALCKDQPVHIYPVLPKKTLSLLKKNKDKLNLYSPISMKVKNQFVYCKYRKNIVYYKDAFYFLKDQEEIDTFIANKEVYANFLEEVKFTLKPPTAYKFEDATKFIFGENMLEYQGCCPGTFLKTGKMVEGNMTYAAEYKNKHYVFANATYLLAFLETPDRFMKIKMPVKTQFEKDKTEEEAVDYENTVEYLESYIGSLVTKGLLKLSKNRIKYPHLTVKESSIKFLALFLKAYNPLNDAYAQKKYERKLSEFIRYSKLPFELLEVYEAYQKCKDDPVRQGLIRRQLTHLGKSYDTLMEKVKIQKNNRFDSFFKD